MCTHDGFSVVYTAACLGSVYRKKTGKECCRECAVFVWLVKKNPVCRNALVSIHVYAKTDFRSTPACRRGYREFSERPISVGNANYYYYLCCKFIDLSRRTAVARRYNVAKLSYARILIKCRHIRQVITRCYL